MSIVLGTTNAYQWASLIFKGVVILNETTKVVKEASKFDLNHWEVRDYAEIISRISCIAADGFTLQSNWNAMHLEKLASSLGREITEDQEVCTQKIMANKKFCI
jgi:hypothetical protein